MRYVQLHTPTSLPALHCTPALWHPFTYMLPRGKSSAPQAIRCARHTNICSVCASQREVEIRVPNEPVTVPAGARHTTADAAALPSPDIEVCCSMHSIVLMWYCHDVTAVAVCVRAANR
jgi:hypothetical protein